MTVVRTMCESCEQRPASRAVTMSDGCAPFLVCESCAPVVAAPRPLVVEQLDLVLS